MMSHFYVLMPEEGIRFGKKWAYADVVDPAKYYDDGVRCPSCGGFVSSKRWTEPHYIKLSSAKPEKWGDFVWGAGLSLLISNRFKEIYEKEGLTGIEEISKPVDIVRIGKHKAGQFPVALPEYHLIQVPWGGANQDDLASGLVHEKPEKIKCSYCRVGVTWRKQDRIIIEEGSWNGKDIFKPRNAPVPFVVSERFLSVAVDYNLKNIWLIAAEKYGYDERRLGLWYVTE